MAGTPFHLDRVVFFGRTFEEYLDMFDLKFSDLGSKEVLDCPSGPDGFVAEAKRRGAKVTGSDPMYHQSVSGLRRIALSDIASTMTKLSNDPLWQLDNLEKYHAEKLKAMENFLQDYAQGMKEGRYVAAALPKLPFANSQFDLVLSAHLLFCYASPENGGIWPQSPLDLDFHRKAVDDLLRVCRHELRLYPIYAMNSETELNAIAVTLMKELPAKGYQVETRPSKLQQTKTSSNLLMVIKKKHG